MALIYYLTQIQSEFGAIKLLRQECERVGISLPLVVTDQGVKAAGILQIALDVLPAMTVAVFDRTPSNPSETAVRAAAEVLHAKACDGLVAVVGGSAIDCAKGVAIAGRHKGPLKNYATIGRFAPHHRAGRAADRGAHHQWHRQRSCARRDPDSGRPPQAGFPLLALASQGRDLRPGTDVRTTGPADRRHRHGRCCALHGNLHGAGLQSAGRWHSSGRPGAGLAVPWVFRRRSSPKS